MAVRARWHEGVGRHRLRDNGQQMGVWASPISGGMGGRPARYHGFT